MLPTYRRPAGLARVLAGLAAQAGAPPYEVVVVDNDPAPHAAARRCRPGWPAASSSSRCPVRPAARNRGIAEATAPLLAMLDDDVVPDPGWLRGAGRARARRPGRPHRRPGLLDPAVPRSAVAVAGDRGLPDGARPRAGRAPARRGDESLLTASLLTRTDLLRASGGFDLDARPAAADAAGRRRRAARARPARRRRDGRVGARRRGRARAAGGAAAAVAGCCDGPTCRAAATGGSTGRRCPPRRAGGARVAASWWAASCGSGAGEGLACGRAVPRRLRPRPHRRRARRGGVVEARRGMNAAPPPAAVGRCAAARPRRGSSSAPRSAACWRAGRPTPTWQSTALARHRRAAGRRRGRPTLRSSTSSAGCASSTSAWSAPTASPGRSPTALDEDVADVRGRLGRCAQSRRTCCIRVFGPTADEQAATMTADALARDPRAATSRRSRRTTGSRRRSRCRSASSTSPRPRRRSGPAGRRWRPRLPARAERCSAAQRWRFGATRRARHRSPR